MQRRDAEALSSVSVFPVLLHLTPTDAGKAEVIAQNILEQYKRSRNAHSTVLDRLPTATVLHVTA
jgi:hypothetical protein